MTDKGCLFLCATPIGNLGDITLRVLETLREADIIACEDTRQTRKLLSRFQISKPLTSYFEHNQEYKGEIILEMLREGKKVALVSDAGMPGISDPGSQLVTSCIEEGLEFYVLPGASAATTALVLSGFDTRRYCFEGFLERKEKEKKKRLAELKNEERTLIFYEAPHRLQATLESMKEIWGAERRIAVCRELTKKFEEVYRGSIEEARTYFAEKGIKGEFVLVVQGAEPIVEERGLGWAEARFAALVATGISPKEAVKQAANEADISKRELYEKVMVKGK